MKKTFFNNCLALLRKSSKALIISALSIFYFSNMSLAQCTDCSVQIDYFGDEIQLTSACDDPAYVHVWKVTSTRCGDHYNNATNYGNVATLYNLACEGTTESCNFTVTHCIYKVSQSNPGLPDLTQEICCTTIVL
jgi:hypothetical protein